MPRGETAVRTSQRLFLAVIPAVVGVLAVAGLAYWGQYAQRAPHIVVIIAAVAAVGSLVMAWYNTRYVAQRIAQLAAKVDAALGSTNSTRSRRSSTVIRARFATPSRAARARSRRPTCESASMAS